jgi:hypothetical protein
MVQRLNRYTALRGQDLADSGKIKSLWDDLFRGVRRFYKCYVSRKGYQGRRHGLPDRAHGRPLSDAVEPQGARDPHAERQNVQAMRPGAVIGLDLEDARLGHSG